MCFLVIELGWTPEKMKTWWNRVMVQTKKPNTPEEELEEQSSETPDEAEIDLSPTPSTHIEEPEETLSLKKDEITMEVEAAEEEIMDEVLAKHLVEKQGFFNRSHQHAFTGKSIGNFPNNSLAQITHTICVDLLGLSQP